MRDLRPRLRLESPDEVGAFEQDLLAEFVLARASAGITDAAISADVAAVVVVLTAVAVVAGGVTAWASTVAGHGPRPARAVAAARPRARPRRRVPGRRPVR